MLELVRFDVEDGSSILVEVESTEAGFGRAALGADGIRVAVVSLGQMLKQIREVADVAYTQMTAMATRPDEIELEFGARFDSQVGAVLAKASAAGHVQVRLTWKKSAE